MNNNKKSTQGSQKIKRYIQDLIRNKNFRSDLKRFRNLRKKSLLSSFNDYQINELNTILKEYETLRKRTRKLLKDDLFKIQMNIAENYGLDLDLLDFTLALTENNTQKSEIIQTYIDDLDMCRITNLADDYLNPEMKGDEIIHLRTKTQLFYTAFPVAIAIHSKASKRDVIDYIQKKWPWIENQLRWINEMKALKIRPRKYSQEIIDFIWKYQSLSSKVIKNKLDYNYPKNGLVYYEINTLLRDEKKRRNQELT